MSTKQTAPTTATPVAASAKTSAAAEGDAPKRTTNWAALGDLAIADVPELSEQSLSIEVDLFGRGGPAPSERDTKILDEYRKVLDARQHRHLGYPYNLAYDHQEIWPFMQYSINNLGDPYQTSNYAVHSRPFELAIIDFFAKLWKINKPDYWGYVTTCGTEGNLHGILLAREAFPTGILYASRESHYSVFKAARFYRMQSVAINTLHSGEIDYTALEAELALNRGTPAILSLNIGTTVKGAVDDVGRVLRILDSVGYAHDSFYIHCDGALFALMLPFVKFGPEVSFQLPIDSIAVSGHKFLGCPMPCGVIVTRKKHVDRLARSIEYLNSKDTTIMGSRNGQAPIFMWYSLRRRGAQGILSDVKKCFVNARYLRDQLFSRHVSCMLNDLSTTVVFERPDDEVFIKKWQLACEGGIAHVVVMPSVTIEKIDVFVEELMQSRAQHRKTDRCVAQHIGEMCLCAKCDAVRKGPPAVPIGTPRL